MCAARLSTSSYCCQGGLPALQQTQQLQLLGQLLFPCKWMDKQYVATFCIVFSQEKYCIRESSLHYVACRQRMHRCLTTVTALAVWPWHPACMPHLHLREWKEASVTVLYAGFSYCGVEAEVASGGMATETMTP